MLKDIDNNNTFIQNIFMEIHEFEWDDSNIAHIARHFISADEVEEVAFDDEPWIRKVKIGTRY